MDLIGHKFPVLDHGHVILLDYMGSDQAVVDAARTCYQKGTKKSQDDRGLLRYLYRMRHTSPFESCVAKLHMKLPIFVERQWARHRTAGWNEVSARYSELPEEYYIPKTQSMALQSKINKQGRDEPMPEQAAHECLANIAEVCRDSFEVYHDSLEMGVARELARINLPLNTYTENVWWINLKNLLDLLYLRMDSHAQWEIREYANTIGNEIVAKLFPWTWGAFLAYRVNAMTLSGPEIKVLYSLITGNAIEGKVMTERERQEFAAKCSRLGVSNG